MRRWLALALIAAAWQAAPVSAQQASPTCRVACRISQTPLSLDQRQCLAQCMAGQSITREAPGEARPAGSRATGHGPSAPRTGTTGPPAPLAQPQGAPRSSSPFAAGSANAAAVGGNAATGAAAGGNFGAVYLAIPPNMAYGLAVGQRDRLTAHRLAEGACRNSGANCIMAEDLQQPCAAVAEGVRRAPGAFFMTSDPKTYIVRAITFHSASNRADAERDALEVCRRREGGALTCRIVQAQCGPR